MHPIISDVDIYIIPAVQGLKPGTKIHPQKTEVMSLSRTQTYSTVS